jgi:ribonuclease Y
VIAVIAFVVALFIGFFLTKLIHQKKVGEYDKIGKKILDDAKKEADVVIREASIQAKDVVLQARNEIEQEVKARKVEMQNTERRLSPEGIIHRQEARYP